MSRAISIVLRAPSKRAKPTLYAMKITLSTCLWSRASCPPGSSSSMPMTVPGSACGSRGRCTARLRLGEGVPQAARVPGAAQFPRAGGVASPQPTTTLPIPWQVGPVKLPVVAAAQDRLSVRSTSAPTPAGVRPLGAHSPVRRPLCSMRCRVTPNVVSGAVKIQWTSSVLPSPCKTTPRRVSSALVSSRSSTSYPRWPRPQSRHP